MTDVPAFAIREHTFKPDAEFPAFTFKRYLIWRRNGMGAAHLIFLFFF
ncbi:MAG: hypothetical protein AB7K37_09755 [Cyclobacteriaceae bacterium]